MNARFAILLVLFAVMTGEQPCAWGKMHVSGKTASGGFAANYDARAWADDVGAIESQGTASQRDYEPASDVPYYGYRYSKPDLGWISRDSIGERGGLNLYGMVGNDPVNLIDQLGLVSIIWNDQPALSLPERDYNHTNLETAIARAPVIGGISRLIKSRFDAKISVLSWRLPRKCIAAYRAISDGLLNVSNVMYTIASWRSSTFELYYRGDHDDNIAWVHTGHPFRNGHFGPLQISMGRRLVPADTYLHELAHLTGFVPHHRGLADASSPRDASGSGLFYNPLMNSDIAWHLRRVFTSKPLSRAISVSFGSEEWNALESCCDWNAPFGQ